MKIIKTRFRKWDKNIHVPKNIEKKKKESIEERLLTAKLDGLHKTVIGKHTAFDRDYAIYGENEMDYQKIFPTIKPSTNYFVGQILQNVFFLVEIGELVWVSDHFEMMDFEEEKVIPINLNSHLWWENLYVKPPCYLY